MPKGDLLLQLRDSHSLLEMQTLEGELLTTQRELDAVAATRMSLDRSTASQSESLQLAAEESRLKHRVESLQNEIKLVKRERERLSVVSPVNGKITTWQLDDLLLNRPVQRGQRLLTVVDGSSGWKLKLEVPDDRLGILRQAEEEQSEASISETDSETQQLEVIYELASEPSVERSGRIVKFAPVAQEASEASMAVTNVILAEVAIEDDFSTDQTTALAGVSVRAEVQCGQQSIAYVALHDIWHFLKTRWQLGW